MYKREGILPDEVYERVGKSVIQLNFDILKRCTYSVWLYPFNSSCSPTLPFTINFIKELRKRCSVLRQVFEN